MSIEPNRRIFVAKVSKGAAYVSDFVIFLICSITPFYFYQDIQNSNQEFYIWFQKNILFNWFLWLSFTALLLVYLNTHFRSIEFGEKLITVKKWYWKTRTFNYFEIKEILLPHSDESSKCNIQLSLKHRKKIKIPHYLMDNLTDNGGTHEDLIKFIQEKTDYTVSLVR